MRRCRRPAMQARYSESLREPRISELPIRRLAERNLAGHAQEFLTPLAAAHAFTSIRSNGIFLKLAHSIPILTRRTGLSHALAIPGLLVSISLLALSAPTSIVDVTTYSPVGQIWILHRELLYHTMLRLWGIVVP